MRDALSLADQVISIGEGPVTAERVREALGLVPEDEFINVLDIIAGHRAGDIFDTVNKLADAGVDFGVFLTGFADILRAQLAVVLSGKAEGVSSAAAVALKQRRDLFTAGDLLRMIRAVTTLEPDFRKSAQQQLLIEMLLIRMALLDRTVEIEDLLKGLGGDGLSSERDAASTVRPQSVQQPPPRPAPTPRPATRPGYRPSLTLPNVAPEKPTRNRPHPVQRHAAAGDEAGDGSDGTGFEPQSHDARGTQGRAHRHAPPEGSGARRRDRRARSRVTRLTPETIIDG
jgi:DNA polymerase-3 subunit gamma/tau